MSQFKDMMSKLEEAKALELLKENNYQDELPKIAFSQLPDYLQGEAEKMYQDRSDDDFVIIFGHGQLQTVHKSSGIHAVYIMHKIGMQAVPDHLMPDYDPMKPTMEGDETINEAKDLYVIFQNNEPFEVVSGKKIADSNMQDYRSHPDTKKNKDKYEARPLSKVGDKLKKLKPKSYEKLLKLADQNGTPINEEFISERKEDEALANGLSGKDKTLVVNNSFSVYRDNEGADEKLIQTKTINRLKEKRNKEKGAKKERLQSIIDTMEANYKKIHGKAVKEEDSMLKMSEVAALKEAKMKGEDVKDKDDDPGSDTNAEYDALVKRELKKAGKSLGDMSDEETKAFFKKLDKMHTSDEEEGIKEDIEAVQEKKSPKEECDDEHDYDDGEESEADALKEAQKTGGKVAYQKFLDKKLAKMGYNSIEDIPDDKKDDFFNDVEKEWKADDETVSESMKIKDIDDSDIKKQAKKIYKNKKPNEAMVYSDEGNRQNVELIDKSDLKDYLKAGYKEIKESESALTRITRHIEEQAKSDKRLRGLVNKVTDNLGETDMLINDLLIHLDNKEDPLIKKFNNAYLKYAATTDDLHTATRNLIKMRLTEDTDKKDDE